MGSCVAAYSRLLALRQSAQASPGVAAAINIAISTGNPLNPGRLPCARFGSKSIDTVSHTHRKGGAIPDVITPFRYSINSFPGNGTQLVFELNFAGGYISRDHVSAYTRSSLGAEALAVIEWVSDNTIKVSPAVPTGSTLVCSRRTPINAAIANFGDGSVISENSLDTNAKQAVFLAQESYDAFGSVPQLEALQSAISALALATNRTNHTGTQAIATVSGLTTELAAKLTLAALAAPTSADSLGFRWASTTSTIPVSDKLRRLPRSPEDYGAVGDGFANDAPAIQRALDALTTGGRAGDVRLTGRYKCNSGIVLDARFHNLIGFAVLDFSGAPAGTVCVTVAGSDSEFANGYGQNGSIDGQITIIGPGRATTCVGIYYATTLDARNARILTARVQVTKCGTAFRIGSRACNQTFLACEAFDCDVIFDWLEVADDNDEQITILSGTYFNSRLFVKHRRPAGRISMYGGSADYTQSIFDIIGGKFESFGTHYESNYWADAPVKVSGDGGNVTLNGGWFIIQVNAGNVINYVEVGSGSVVKFNDLKTNNTNNILTPDALTPTTWARGAGRFDIRGTEPAFELGGFPVRAHATQQCLIDADFDTGSLAKSQSWRTADLNAIEDRYGLVLPTGAGAANNLVLAVDTTNKLYGAACLRLNKAFGGGSAASAVVACFPVRPGDKALCGFRARRAPDRPGSGPMFASLSFAALDGNNQFGVPIILQSQSIGGDVTYALASGWGLITPWNGLSQVIAPSWATHCLLTVNLVSAVSASFLIDGRWASTF